MPDSTVPSTLAGNSASISNAPLSTSASTLRACSFHTATGFDLWCGACAMTNGYVPSTQTPIPAQCELVDKAALDALREAVKGCYGPMVVRWDGSGKKCGTPTDIHDRRLCRKCIRKRDSAIALLLGNTGEDSDGR